MVIENIAREISGNSALAVLTCLPTSTYRRHFGVEVAVTFATGEIQFVLRPALPVHPD